MKRESKRLTLFNCNIAGFAYYDGPIAFSELKVGSKLELEAEDNKYDPNAVAIYFGEYKLGFIPKQENQTIYSWLEMGYADVFDVRINRMDQECHPEHQIGISVGIVRNEKKEA